MRARMALLLSGRAFRAHEISLRDKPATLLALSPQGTVPVLHLPEGAVLEHSWDVMRWALAPPAAAHWWMPAQTPENLDWVARNDGLFKQHLDRYKYPDRFAGTHPADHRAQALDLFLAPLAHRLATRPFLGGEQACATDLALFPFVRQFAAVEPAWFARQPLAALQAWLSGWLSHPLFQHCMIKLPAQTTVPFPPFASGHATHTADTR
jgi:glutathione S-transferase